MDFCLINFSTVMRPLQGLEKQKDNQKELRRSSTIVEEISNIQ